MTASPPDELPLLEFPSQRHWRDWLAENHAAAPGVWLKFAKQGAPRATVNYAEALEVALCFGWIDSQVGRLDAHFYRQRFTPRGRRSRWSQINREKATALIEAGLMEPPGLAEVERAQLDGRWDAAYASPAKAVPPDDFLRALRANHEAEAFFATLSATDRYPFIYRIEEAKRPETRAGRITKYVELLAAHQTLH